MNLLKPTSGFPVWGPDKGARNPQGIWPWKPAGLDYKTSTDQSVQSFSPIWLFESPSTPACQSSLSISNSRGLLRLMSIESVMPYNHLIVYCPLLPPSIFPSIRVFSNESVLHIRWPKYWSFSFTISSSNEYSGLTSFRMDWLDLLAVQGTLKSLLQHHSSKALILQCSAFFIVQLSHLYMTTGKTRALTRRHKRTKFLNYFLITYCMSHLKKKKLMLFKYHSSPRTFCATFVKISWDACVRY